MWLKKLQDIYSKQINFGPLSYLNTRHELHLAIYIIESLKDTISFNLNEDKKIQITKNDKNIDTSEFMYWWQVTRHKEICDEEKKLISTFESIKKK